MSQAELTGSEIFYLIISGQAAGESASCLGTQYRTGIIILGRRIVIAIGGCGARKWSIFVAGSRNATDISFALIAL